MERYEVGDKVESTHTHPNLPRQGTVRGVVLGEGMDIVLIEWERTDMSVFDAAPRADVQFVVDGMDVHGFRKAQG